MRLRLHAIQPHSRANGPGGRFVIWTQGCSLNCPGCFNPETHAVGAGHWRHASELAEEVSGAMDRDQGLEGITLTGGEPLEQAEAVLDLLDHLENRQLSRFSTLLFTGWTQTEIDRDACARTVLERVDAAVCGRFDATRSTFQGRFGSTSQGASSGVVASSNQELILVSDRYHANDFIAVPQSEAIVHEDGTITLTGVRPLRGIERRGTSHHRRSVS